MSGIAVQALRVSPTQQLWPPTAPCLFPPTETCTYPSRPTRACQAHSAGTRPSPHKVRSNLGPDADELGPEPSTTTLNKTRRTNKIDFLRLPWAQEVPSSNLGAPTKLFKYLAERSIS